MEELLKEVMSAVENINEKLYEQQDDTTNVLTIIIEPVMRCVQINLQDHTIWYNQEDDREWVEEDRYIRNIDGGEVITPAHYEDMEPYLRKKIMEIVKQISDIKL